MEQSRKRPPEEDPQTAIEGPESLSRPISPPRKKARASPPTLLSPWHLTWIRDLPEDLNKDAMTLTDLLGDPMISECWEFNYLHDIPFLMDAFDNDTRHMVKVHVVHGFWKQEDRNRQRLMHDASRYSNLQLHVAPMPEMFGTHHCKMMILFRHDETAQVIIHTANLIPKDWTNMTNAVWKSPILSKLANSVEHTDTPSSTAFLGTGARFKRDLLNYLKKYEQRRTTLRPLVDHLGQYDFSPVRAALIASVPGTHKTDDSQQTLWGWPALKQQLQSVPCVEGPADIAVQISSIATLGAKDEWLRKVLFDSLAQSQNLKQNQRPKFKVVFPTADEIRRSIDGYASGASIHTKTQSKQQEKQLHYLRPHFYHWANDSVNGQVLPDDVPTLDGGRARAAPHIKTYIRYNSDSIDWAMLTSANLSKQAWGEACRPASGEVRIASWEIGVLVWPELIEEGSKMVPTFKTDLPTLSELDDDQTQPLVGIRVPYNLPLQKYGAQEVPWVATMTHKEPDQRGQIWVSGLAMGRDRSIGASNRDFHSALSSSFRSSSPLAEQYLAQDIAACSDDDVESNHEDGLSEVDHHGNAGHFTYRRPSGVTYGGFRPVLNPQAAEDPGLSPLERKQSRDAERSLLRDNHILPPKHGERKHDGLASRAYHRLFSTKVPSHDEDGPRIVVDSPDEQSPLLGGSARGAAPPPDSPEEDICEDVEDQWIQAVAEGRIRTTWQREAKTLSQYATPLIATFFLQYSINAASIFAVGRIGSIELGAVSLANMTAAITCLAPFQGLATSLDTLCAQAYGSGHKHLVGLQCQRMVCFLFTLTPPVAVIWYFSEHILSLILPEPESARLAGLYLKVMIFGVPGIVLFECGKRFTQAQGIFHATTYVLFIVAPLNIFICWLLVWKLEYGFIGAPISVVITENLLPLLLFLFVRFVDGSQCWGGFSKRAFSNWWVMIRLALPGMIMVEAEWLAFEIMTLLASRFGSNVLAAQSILSTLASISYQIPFPVSIAASTRIANLIGAGLVDAAKTASKVAFITACIIGVFNLTLFTSLRYYLPLLLTKDPEVIELVAHVLPVVAVMQVFDGVSAGAHGILRGIGRQSIGGPANIIAYYVISLPISLGLAFGLGWQLQGMWLGVTVGLIVVSLIEYTYLLNTNWHSAAREAQSRNEAN
ncbi:unnamed protein product [Clonostachys rosea f. rosea IK726]|uniref:Uncharacterized protein n=1 Tax=Clonostachys rosea f. rosea IK726 TaxID=1349383 RepID=A0ACA9T8X3_BIOOC|nr:unnamed protein product [Clonostachys rosea f. rosea IK726]